MIAAIQYFLNIVISLEVIPTQDPRNNPNSIKTCLLFPVNEPQEAVDLQGLCKVCRRHSDTKSIKQASQASFRYLSFLICEEFVTNLTT